MTLEDIFRLLRDDPDGFFADALLWIMSNVPSMGGGRMGQAEAQQVLAMASSGMQTGGSPADAAAVTWANREGGAPPLQPGVNPWDTRDAATTTVAGDVAGDVAGGVGDAQFADLPTREGSLRRLLAQGGGRAMAFRDFIGQQFDPSASPFLRSALESRFRPLHTLFQGREALGEVRPAIGGAAQELGYPRTFQDFIRDTGARAPTQATIENMATRVAAALAGGPVGPSANMEFYIGEPGSMTGPDRQFDLALESVMNRVPISMQAGFGRTARRKFQDFVAQNPEQAGQFLPQFVERGFRF